MKARGSRQIEHAFLAWIYHNLAWIPRGECLSSLLMFLTFPAIFGEIVFRLISSSSACFSCDLRGHCLTLLQLRCCNDQCATLKLIPCRHNPCTAWPSSSLMRKRGCSVPLWSSALWHKEQITRIGWRQSNFSRWWALSFTGNVVHAGHYLYTCAWLKYLLFFHRHQADSLLCFGVLCLCTFKVGKINSIGTKPAFNSFLTWLTCLAFPLLPLARVSYGRFTPW